jgi:hypothetical protein
MMRNVGMRCIRRPRNVGQNPAPWPKTSAAKMLMKAANTMHSTLGVQYSRRCTGLVIAVFSPSVDDPF